MLLNFELVPYGDIKNILRVLAIQVSSTKFDQQLKLLQILLQMANWLSRDSQSSQFLTETTVCSFLTLSLQLCESKNNISVSSTALGTARQIIALIMDGTLAMYRANNADVVSNGNENEVYSSEADLASSSFSLCSIMLIREVALFVRGMPGEWLRGVVVPQSFALDLMFEILDGWKYLFYRVSSFKALLHSVICPALKPLLKNLQDEHISATIRVGLTAAAALTARIVRIARIIILNFLSEDLFVDFELLIILLIHSLQPDRGSIALPTSLMDENKSKGDDLSNILTPGGAGAILSRIGGSLPIGLISNPNATQHSKGQNTSTTGLTAAQLNSISGFYITLTSSTSKPMPSSANSSIILKHATINSSSSSQTSQIPSHPAGASLEALLSFLIDNSCFEYLISRPDGMRLAV
eukprot:gene18236-25652_t